MKQRISILTAFLLFVAVLCTQAQERRRPSTEEIVKRSVERLKEQLELTKEQEPKVAEIVTKYTKPFDPEGDREAQIKERQENNAKMAQAIDSLLTKEQKVKYAKMQEEMKNRRRNNEGGNRPPRGERPDRN